MSQLHLDDRSLVAAAESLIRAADALDHCQHLRAAPTLQTLTTAGDDIAQFVRGLELATTALADGAVSACQSLTQLMHQGDELDSLIAAHAGVGRAGDR